MQAIPQHVGIIMDGNGRWATIRGKARHLGHYEGVKRTEEVVLHAKAVGIKYLTLYAFSTENWTRPGYEVTVLMKLGRQFMVRRQRDIDSLQMGIRFIGDRSRFPKSMRRLMDDVEKKSLPYTDFVLQVALSYGGRQEIAMACDRVVQAMISGELEKQTVTPELISQYLYTSGVPDPDLIIRTSGEIRTSNFLPWQSVYAEWIFRDELWPDFTSKSFDECIAEYCCRERRMGNIPQQQVG